MLDCNPGQWQGDARTAFENDYASQQYRLGQLADHALTPVKAQVDTANGQAGAAMHGAGASHVS
jgi:hypothetical protein